MFVINHIKNDFGRGNNISEALQNLEYKNSDNLNPILKASTLSDDDAKVIEDRQFKLQFKANYREAQKLKMWYQDNQYKAYGLIWEVCVKAKKAKIEANKDFEDGIYNNPVELLKALKQHSLNHQYSRYEMLVILDRFNTFFGTRKKDQESLQDYTRRFKKLYELLQSHIGGPIQLQILVKTLNGFTDDLENNEEFLMKEQLLKQVSK